MANYYSSARTNYFRVKDVDAFNVWVKEFEDNHGVEVVDKEGHLLDCRLLHYSLHFGHVIVEDGGDVIVHEKGNQSVLIDVFG
jgi:hypothetical protein